MGYAGGTKKDPKYHSLGDHTETIQIDYDPTQISYAALYSPSFPLAAHDQPVRRLLMELMAAGSPQSGTSRIEYLPQNTLG